jgi:hypothetical protein
MSKFNILFHIQNYKDATPTNTPQMSHFKWTREQQGLSSDAPISQEFALAPSESKDLFNGSRTLSHNGSTEYSLYKKPLVSNTYILEWNGNGAAPAFRTSRAIGSDATTEITVTKNGDLVTLTNTAGTAIDLVTGLVVVGDLVSLGAEFNSANQGVFKILSRTANSLSLENSSGSAEVVVLGASYETALEIFSSNGVQVGDTLKILGGFSPVSRESFDITAVYSDRVEFFSAKVLPEESDVQTNAISIYSSAKKFIYIESSDKITLTINGTSQVTVEPFVEATGNKPGMYFQKSTIWSLSCSNDSINMATIYLAAIE